jgi:hypothetical protein
VHRVLLYLMKKVRSSCCAAAYEVDAGAWNLGLLRSEMEKGKASLAAACPVVTTLWASLDHTTPSMLQALKLRVA